MMHTPLRTPSAVPSHSSASSPFVSRSAKKQLAPTPKKATAAATPSSASKVRGAAHSRVLSTASAASRSGSDVTGGYGHQLASASGVPSVTSSCGTSRSGSPAVSHYPQQGSRVAVSRCHPPVTAASKGAGSRNGPQSLIDHHRRGKTSPSASTSTPSKTLLSTTATNNSRVGDEGASSYTSIARSILLNTSHLSDTVNSTSMNGVSRPVTRVSDGEENHPRDHHLLPQPQNNLKLGNETPSNSALRTLEHALAILEEYDNNSTKHNNNVVNSVRELLRRAISGGDTSTISAPPRCSTTPTAAQLTMMRTYHEDKAEERPRVGAAAGSVMAAEVALATNAPNTAKLDTQPQQAQVPESNRSSVSFTSTPSPPSAATLCPQMPVHHRPEIPSHNEHTARSGTSSSVSPYYSSQYAAGTTAINHANNMSGSNSLVCDSTTTSYTKSPYASYVDNAHNTTTSLSGNNPLSVSIPRTVDPPPASTPPTSSYHTPNRAAATTVALVDGNSVPKPRQLAVHPHIWSELVAPEFSRASIVPLTLSEERDDGTHNSSGTSGYQTTTTASVPSSVSYGSSIYCTSNMNDGGRAGTSRTPLGTSTVNVSMATMNRPPPQRKTVTLAPTLSTAADSTYPAAGTSHSTPLSSVSRASSESSVTSDYQITQRRELRKSRMSLGGMMKAELSFLRPDRRPEGPGWAYLDREGLWYNETTQKYFDGANGMTYDPETEQWSVGTMRTVVTSAAAAGVPTMVAAPSSAAPTANSQQSSRVVLSMATTGGGLSATYDPTSGTCYRGSW